MKALFTNLCPNCRGEIDDSRLEKHLPCKRCLTDEVEEGNYNTLVKTVFSHLKNKDGYTLIYNTVNGLEEFEAFFKKYTGYPLWSAQRSWTKRLLLNKSFSIVAPTGVGKSLFGTMYAAFLAEKGKRSYIIVPTSTLVKQTLDRLSFREDAIGFYSAMTQKRKEEIMERLRSGDFRILVTTSQFLARRFEDIPVKFDFIFVDDVDALLKSSKNIDRVLLLLGFQEKDIETALSLIREKILLARGKGDRKKVEHLEKILKKRKKDIKGSLVVASATGRSRGLRSRLFRELLDFEVGSSRAQLRNVINVYTKEDDISYWIRRLGGGGIIFVSHGEDEAKRITDELNNIGIRAAFAGGEKAVSALESFAKGEVDILVGSAYYYGTLVRGIDLPERVRYTVFVGVPKFRFGMDFEGINPGRAAFLLDILYDITSDSSLRTLANRLRRYAREEDLEEAKKMLRELISKREILDKLKEHPDIVIEEGDKLYIIIPDYKTYIQGSGRASRMYAGGVTTGLSLLIVDNEKVFELLRRILFNVYGESFSPVKEVNLEDILRKIDEERRRIRERSWKDPVRTILFVVESPNKARTIARFFGRPSVYRIGSIRGYEVTTGDTIVNVVATRGHMFDLVTDRGFHGVLVNDRIIPVYTTIKRCNQCGTQTTDNVCPKCGSTDLEDAIERVNALRLFALEMDEVLIGTDPDTEGEKIAWDVMLAISPYNPSIKRSEFHEVTKNALLKAIREPRSFNINRVDAQIVRRVEDRWIGFELSQKLWTVFGNRGLSAGRVQTPVLGWIIERYMEHKKQVAVFLSVDTEVGRFVFETPFRNINQAKAYGNSGIIRIELLESREEIKHPPPPFTTDTLIRDGGNVLRLGAKEIMDLAQDLFEAGLITYHRTDSTHVSSTGIAIAKEYISSKWGEDYFRGRSWGREGAHECIRPTRSLDTETLIRYIREGEIVVEGISKQHLRLYDLIFRRFMESQMKEAKVIVSKYRVTLEALSTEEERISDIVERGWMVLENIEPSPLKEGAYKPLSVLSYKASKIPLYTQSDVVALMKERGIGRPSTYATILQKLLERRYIIETKSKRRLYPTRRGIEVFNYLNSKFYDLVSEERTKMLEMLMEEIEEGRLHYMDVLKELYREIVSTRGII